jgi:hypothetical protein
MTKPENRKHELWLCVVDTFSGSVSRRWSLKSLDESDVNIMAMGLQNLILDYFEVKPQDDYMKLKVQEMPSGESYKKDDSV